MEAVSNNSRQAAPLSPGFSRAGRNVEISGNKSLVGESCPGRRSWGLRERGRCADHSSTVQ